MRGISKKNIVEEEWNKSKTLKSGDILTPMEAYARIGNAITLNEQLFIDYVVFSIIQKREIGIELTNELSIKPETQYKSNVFGFDVIQYVARYNDVPLFEFDCKMNLNKHDPFDKDGTRYFEFEFKEEQLHITSEYMIDFKDDDVKYLMKEFPYYFKLIKYVMHLFISELKSIFSIRDDYRSNNNDFTKDKIFFIEQPIDDDDKKMYDILQNIYASRLKGHFNRKRPR